MACLPLPTKPAMRSFIIMATSQSISTASNQAPCMSVRYSVLRVGVQLQRRAQPTPKVSSPPSCPDSDARATWRTAALLLIVGVFYDDPDDFGDFCMTGYDAPRRSRVGLGNNFIVDPTKRRPKTLGCRKAGNPT